MSYEHGFHQEKMAAAASLASAADIVTREFFMPVQVLAVALRMTTTATVTAPILGVYKRPTAGSDTNRVLLRTITSLLTNWAAAEWIYAFMTADDIIKPGMDLVVEVGTPATAGAADVWVCYKDSWVHQFSNLGAHMVEAN